MGKYDDFFDGVRSDINLLKDGSLRSYKLSFSSRV